MKNYHQYCVVYLLLATVFMAGCNSESEDKNPLTEEEEESVEVRPEVIFAVTDDSPIYYHVEAQGVVEAHQEILLKPKISGFVEQSNIIEGARIQKGDTLLSFYEDEWQLALDEARNVYEEKLSEYRIRVNQRAGGTDTLGTNGNTEKSDRMIRITSGLSQAEVDLNRARLNLSYATMSAPFSGRLAVEKRVEPGSFVSSGTELATLINDVTVRVRFEVLDAEVNRIEPGMSAEVTTPDSTVLTGFVSAVSPVVDQESKTGEAIVKIDNRSGKLRPGMTVGGRIQVEKLTGKVRIPRSAVLERDGGRTLVFKLHPDKEEVEWIYVEPTFQNNEWALIDHPDIEPGDTLAVDKHFALSHLQKVDPKLQFLQLEESDVEAGN